MAEPGAPGVHTVNPASQWPAHATPLGARVRIEVSLEVKVIVVFRLVPEAVCTAAVKFRVPPRFRDVVGPGLSVTLPAKRGGPGLDPPPHAGKPSSKETINTDHRPLERNLPMHSSLVVSMVLAVMLLGIDQGSAHAWQDKPFKRIGKLVV